MLDAGADQWGEGCLGEVFGNPNSGESRTGQWDGGHEHPWSKQQFDPDVERPEVIDRYQINMQLECYACNRRDGNRRVSLNERNTRSNRSP